MNGMMKSFLVAGFILTMAGALAQKETFDIITFTLPAGWTKESGNDNMSVTKINNADKTWCKIGLYKSMNSKGSVELDFNADWKSLVYEPLKVNEKQPKTEISEAEGWKIMNGGGTFVFNGSNAMAILTTISGFGKTVSIVSMTNSETYLSDIEAILGSIDLQKPSGDNKLTDNKVVSTNKPSTAKKDKYAFHTTNFDDGWTATVQEDWVEVTKDNIKVLIHYPKEGTIIQADPEPFINNAWNILVAPRYSNIRNYSVAKTITEYDRAYFSSANLRENSTGREVYVSLFKRSTYWIEIVCPDKNTFIKYFGFDANTITWDTDSRIYDKVQQMAGYNKFAIAATDFPGKWSNNFANNTYYANIYTGMSAGMSTYASAETFEFAGNTYKWDIIATNSYGGSTSYISDKSTGTYKVLNNWQIYLSKIGKSEKTYNAYFSCIKGARILWLQDTAYGGYTSYGRIE